MDLPNILYLASMSLSFILSIRSYRHDTSIRIFPLLLLISLLTESIVYIMFYKVKLELKYNVVYHIYIPVEYALLSYYFRLNIKSPAIGKIVSLSIPAFTLSSIFISSYKGLYAFPGDNLNLAGFFLILWATVTLFTIEPREDFSITSLPLFWICVGVLTYYSGSFFFNGVYQHFMDSHADLAKRLNHIINKGLNIVLYTCFSIAFICSRQMKKYCLRQP